MLPGAARIRLLGEQVGAERRAAVHGGAGSGAGVVPSRAGTGAGRRTGAGSRHCRPLPSGAVPLPALPPGSFVSRCRGKSGRV